MNNPGILFNRARALRLNGLIAHWDEIADAPWLAAVLQWEEEERSDRSLRRRMRAARLGHFRQLADYDWKWPRRIDRTAIEELMTLSFVKEAANIVFIGPNGVGKSTLALNVAYQALVAGHSVLLRTASEMLGELAAIDSDSMLRRKLQYYAAPDVLVIDEVGYLSYSNRHALRPAAVSRRTWRCPQPHIVLHPEKNTANSIGRLYPRTGLIRYVPLISTNS
ncbi:ATP-binding protein [Ensifer sp. SL37]|uniref:ATP-binding protein n=1 Tax=Ensifer sp. SL37 TaxID=2995137 RepID=UPI002276C982|nr:ATP-binding protein [Ensifer sp. SL37]MCY1740531.1 ATP-binding protein [Ensifer sp. SL37]